MDQINREDFSTWLKQASGPCVSIFMPVHPGSDQSQQDPIRLKNLLQQAQEDLVRRGMRQPPSPPSSATDPCHQLSKRWRWGRQVSPISFFNENFLFLT